MNKVTKTALDELEQTTEEARLTLYMPTHKQAHPRTTQEDQTRYKNILREGVDKWRESVSDSSILKDSLEELESFYADEDFWKETSYGLAVFADKDEVSFYHLPIECEQRVCVGAEYDLAPMYAALQYNQPYYLLALAMHNTKLFRGDAYGLEYVDMEFPASPEDALGIDEMYANSDTQRGFEGPAHGGYELSMHGSGDSSEAGREERLQYFRIIDKKLCDSKDIDHDIPVLLAATDSEAGDFRNMSNLRHLLPVYMAGNYTKHDVAQLHEKSWPIVEKEVVQVGVDSVIDQFVQQQGTQKASSNIDDIREAAEMGKVDTLLLRVIDQTNDSVTDTAESDHSLLRFDESYDKQKIESLVRSVCRHGGKIVAVAKSRLHTPALAAAIYRY